MSEPEYYSRFIDRPQWGAVVGAIGLGSYLLAMLIWIGWLLMGGGK